MEQSVNSSATVADAMNMIKSGNVHDAVIILKAITADSPQDAQAYTCLGVAYTQSGDKLNAINAFEKALSLQENPKAHYNLGLAYESADMKDEAAKSYQKAVDLDPAYTLASGALKRLAPAITPARVASTQPAAAATIVAQTTVEEPTIIGQAPDSPDLTVMGAPPPVVPEPVVIGHVPDFGAPTGLPDLAREEAERAQRFAEQRKDYMKSSLIYGVVCGSMFMLAMKFIFMFFGMGIGLSAGSFILGLIGTAIEGGILGAMVGLWVGYTCGDDMQGLLAGVVIGAVVGLFTGLISGAGVFALFFMLLYAFFIGIFGFFVGRMVESSIN